jgi:hypothetical protein
LIGFVGQPFVAVVKGNTKEIMSESGFVGQPFVAVLHEKISNTKTITVIKTIKQIHL